MTPPLDEVRVAVEGASGVPTPLLDRVIREAAATVVADGVVSVEPLLEGDDGGRLMRIAVSAAGEQAAFLAHAVVEELAALGEVARAEADLPVRAFDPAAAEAAEHPVDAPPPSAFGPATQQIPEQARQHDWSQRLLRVGEAWELSEREGRASRGEGIRVGHPDTGYTTHPWLGLNALDRDRDWDFVDNDDDPLDPLTRGAVGIYNPGHGTATGSVIAGRSHEDKGVGVAPRATVVAFRAIRGVVQVFDSDVARAVDRARRENAHVISMSLGGKGFFGLRRAIRRALDAGIVVLAAAGNNVQFVVEPAAYREVIAVAGTAWDDSPWEGSSRGSRVDVAAPGEAVHVAAFDWDAAGGPAPIIHPSHGTSFAVANTAGLCALWLAHHGRAALLQRYGASQLTAVLRHLLTGPAVRVPAGWDRRYGAGVVDAVRLLRAELPAPDELTGLGAFDQEADDAVTRLGVLLGDLDRVTVIQRFAEVLRLGAAATEQAPEAVVRQLVRYEGELAYLLAEDDGFRERVLRSSPGAFPPAPPPAAGPGLAALLAGAHHVPARAIVVRPQTTPADRATLTHTAPLTLPRLHVDALGGMTNRLSSPAVTERLGSRLGAVGEPLDSGAVFVDARSVETAGAFGPVDPLEQVGLGLAGPEDLGDLRPVVRQVVGDSVHEVRHLVVRDAEVVGSDHRLTWGPGGTILVTGRLLDVPPQLDPGPPPERDHRLVAEVLRAQLGLEQGTFVRVEPALLPTGESLVWVLRCRVLVDDPVMDLRAYLRADDLELLLAHDLVVAFATGTAYPVNPLRTPEPTDVALLDLFGEVLHGRRFDVVPAAGDRVTGERDGGARLDFRRPPDDAAFDEAAVYHHLTRAAGWVNDALSRDPVWEAHERALTAVVQDRRVRAAVGRYVPSKAELQFDDRMGGRSADIVYHEYAHALTDAICRLYRNPGPQARMLGEGYADYLACAITDDPIFGDAVTGQPDGARNCSDPSLRFPDGYIGEEHAVGAVWAAVLWDLRATLGPAPCDRLVLHSLYHLVPGSTMDDGLGALLSANRLLPGDHEDAIREAFAHRHA